MSLTHRSQLEFLHWARIPGYDVPIERGHLGYHTLQFVEKGHVVLEFADQVHNLGPGTFWASYPDSKFTYRPAQAGVGFLHRYVAFQGPMARDWEAEDLLPPIPQTVSSRKLCSSLFDRLLARLEYPGHRAHRKAVNLLEQILLEVVEDSGAQQKADQWLEAALRELNANPSFEPDIARIAEAAGMGVSTLRHKFRAAMGVPLSEFVILRRIRKARQALFETDRPIKAVAADLGYRDIHYFNRQFRSRVGTPPAAYRTTSKRHK